MGTCGLCYQELFLFSGRSFITFQCLYRPHHPRRYSIQSVPAHVHEITQAFEPRHCINMTNHLAFFSFARLQIGYRNQEHDRLKHFFPRKSIYTYAFIIIVSTIGYFLSFNHFTIDGWIALRPFLHYLQPFLCSALCAWVYAWLCTCALY